MVRGKAGWTKLGELAVSRRQPSGDWQASDFQLHHRHSNGDWELYSLSRSEHGEVRQTWGIECCCDGGAPQVTIPPGLQALWPEAHAWAKTLVGCHVQGMLLEMLRRGQD